jgi:hypothetical protein
MKKDMEIIIEKQYEGTSHYDPKKWKEGNEESQE